uniref:Ixodegrin-2A RGD containing protein n=1 Tax=Ixodes scapularis TaxID=6945 RepID=Q4PML0_IXOSC|nr:ixodegrin-2A RGD containing protein [Ixodes scapularis]
MNTFIVVLVSSLVLTTFGVFADSDQQPQVPSSETNGVCSSKQDCNSGQCCLETFRGDMVLVTCSPLAGPGASCSNSTEGDEPYQNACPCEPGLECINNVCTALPVPVPVE